jgi:hypothetical protein
MKSTLFSNEKFIKVIHSLQLNDCIKLTKTNKHNNLATIQRENPKQHESSWDRKQ